MFDKIKSLIDQGREGRNKASSMGLPKVESVIDGVTRGTYTLIISSSGVGKSSFSLFSYVYKPIMEHINDDDFRVLFFSLEMSAETMFIKLLSIYIHETFGVDLSYKDILSMGRDKKLSDMDYNVILSSKDWISRVEKKIEFYDKQINAKILYRLVMDRIEKLGEINETKTRWTFTPKNPNFTYVVIIDHIGLVIPQPGNTLKMEIDDISKYLVTLREKCGISPVVIQQANRDHSSSERIRSGRTSFSLSDSKDSGNTVNDCNIMLAIYDPLKDGIKNYRGIDIGSLNGRFRSLQILKNRFGESDIEIPLLFDGNINYFSEYEEETKRRRS